MNRIARQTVVRLLLFGLIVPPAQGVLFWIERLLRAMQDTTGATWVARLILVLGVLWLIDLVLLVLALGYNAANITSGEDDTGPE